LRVPAVGEQVVVKGEEGAVDHQHRVIATGDRLGAPPLVVDPPAVGDARDRARRAPAATLDRQRLTAGVELNADRTWSV